MKIYLDSDFRCHLENDGAMTLMETDAFDGKCSKYIEGFRYIPEGETWTRSDGVEFRGLMISPAENYSILKKTQEQYELDQIEQCSNLSIKQENDFIATHNYYKDEYLSVNGNIYKTIYSIPKGCTITINQNVIQSTIQEYLDSLKEEDNEKTNF